jgi:DNA-binding transcriptional LysR family regulator
MKITFKQLEVFVEIAKMSNMTLAAENVFLTQSACSMALSSLENQLGNFLFDRHGKKLLLNDQGKLLFPKASGIISQMQELEDLLMSKRTGMLSGKLRVGASSTIGNYLLPTFVGKFITKNSEVKIGVEIGNTEQIIQQVLKFTVDIGMIEGDCFSEDIQVTPWKKDELIIVASPAYALAKKRKISLSDIQHEKWIMRELGSGTREQFEKAVEFKVRPFLELGNTEAIKQAVILNLGVSCLSKSAVADALKSERLVELSTPLKLTRDFNIIMHKDKYKTELLSEFINCL